MVSFVVKKKKKKLKLFVIQQTVNGELRITMNLSLKTMWEAFEHNLKVGRDKKNLWVIVRK